jgi:hypothetical protein
MMLHAQKSFMLQCVGLFAALMVSWFAVARRVQDPEGRSI